MRGSLQGRLFFLIYWFLLDLNCRDAESVNNTKENIVNFNIENILLEADLNFG